MRMCVWGSVTHHYKRRPQEIKRRLANCSSQCVRPVHPQTLMTQNKGGAPASAAPPPPPPGGPPDNPKKPATQHAGAGVRRPNNLTINLFVVRHGRGHEAASCKDACPAVLPCMHRCMSPWHVMSKACPGVVPVYHLVIYPISMDVSG